MVVEPVQSTLASGYYYYGTTLELYTLTIDSTIRYTTNGTDPTESSTLYTGPIPITSDFTLKARGYKQGFAPSPVSIYIYSTGPMPHNYILSFTFDGLDVSTEIDNDANQIIVTVPYDTYLPSLVPLIQVEEGCFIYPESGIPQNFSNPVSYTVSSLVGQRVYLVTVLRAPAVFTPEVNLPGGTYSSPITLELSTATPFAFIKYTTNGSTPTLASQTYNGPFTISSTTTLKAKTYLYTGPHFGSSSGSSKVISSQSSKSFSTLIPATVMWLSSSLLTETYSFPKKTPNKNKQDITIQKEKPNHNISSEK